MQNLFWMNSKDNTHKKINHEYSIQIIKYQNKSDSLKQDNQLNQYHATKIKIS